MIKLFCDMIFWFKIATDMKILVIRDIFIMEEDLYYVL